MDLKRIRKSKNLRQIDVAQGIGITFQTYSSYETEKTNPSPDLLCKLADFFGVTVDALLGREAGLFDDARVKQQQVLSMYEQLTVHQQDLIMERMQAFIDTNREYNKQKQVLSTPIVFVPSAKKSDEEY